MNGPYLAEMKDVLGHDLVSMDRALSRSLVDADFRARLLKDARLAFAEEGVQFPDGVSVTCHDLDINDRHIFIPPMVRDPEPVEEKNRAPGWNDRPDSVPNTPPVHGAVRPGLARPFLLGSNYPARRGDLDEPDKRW